MENKGENKEIIDFHPKMVEIDRNTMSSSYEAPRNEVEEILVEHLGNILGIADIGTHDIFFEMGGNSLLASQYAAQLSETLDLEVSIAEILESRDIAVLATVLTKRLLEDMDISV